MNKTTRRDFLKQSAAYASAASVVPYFLSSERPALAQAPSDRLRMGCIGLASMGSGDASQFGRMLDIVAVCDVDSNHLARAKADRNIGRGVADDYKDYRKILERNDIDVVSVVTPDHWHTKICIEALQSGKHVFCQKPLTLTLEENVLIREACKKYNKVFLVGTQQRAQRDQFALATLMVRKGLLGKIQKITCHIDGSPGSGPIPKADVPEALDFEMWLGQAPLVDYIASSNTATWWALPWPANSRTHYEYRWWYEYSGGKFTDWGAHHIDSALWAMDMLGEGEGPIKVNPLIAEHPVPYKDGYPTEDNRYNTSTRFDIECTFENGLVMNVVSHSRDGNGILFEGTEGRIHVNRQRIRGGAYDAIGGLRDERGNAVPYSQNPELQKVFPPEEFDKLYNDKPFGDGDMGHKRNFIQCIREGGLPASDVYSHIQVMNVCHLCVIAARLGREVAWDPKAEKCGDEQSQSFAAREQRKGYEIPRG